MDSQISITARDAVHKFAHYAELAESGKEIIIRRRGKVTLKLVRAEPANGMTQAERELLIGRCLSFRLSKPYGKKFERAVAYGD